MFTIFGETILRQSYVKRIW